MTLILFATGITLLVAGVLIGSWVSQRNSGTPMKNTLALTAMVLTIILAFLAVTGAFPARRRIYSCNYSVVSNKESCWVSAVYWDDGWMFKAK